MPLSPLNAVSRNLTWDDFVKTPKAAPGAGEAATGAETKIFVASETPQMDPKSKPGAFKLLKEPTVTITFDKTSWVASFVFDWPKTMQDDLLAHEQVHYLIGALSGRDHLNAMKVILEKTYATGAELSADIAVAQKVMLSKKVQEKYDDDTKHKPTQNPEIQAKWTNCVIGCRTSGAPLKPALAALGLFTEQ